MCAAPGGCRGASAWGGALCSHSGRTRTPAVPAKDSPDLRPVSGEDGVAGALRVNPRCARAPTQGRHVAHRRGFLPPGTCPGPATLHTHNSYTAERSQTTSRRGHLGLRRPRDAGTGRGHCPPWTSCPWGRTANRPRSSSLRGAAPCPQAEFARVQQTILQKPLPGHRGRASVTRWGHHAAPPGPSGQGAQGCRAAQTKRHHTCGVNDTVPAVPAAQGETVRRP